MAKRSKKDDKYNKDVMFGGAKPKSNQVDFILREGLSGEDSRRVEREICSWPEVKSVERIFKDADLDPKEEDYAKLSRYYVVYSKNIEQVGEVLSKLKALPEIESAYLPPIRK